MSAVHLDRDGRPRCGNRAARQLTGDASQADCLTCLNIVSSAHNAGREYADLKPCGTPAAYRRHHRRGEQPCQSCRQAEALRHADRDGKDDYDRERRERYAAARAAGLSAREANRRKSLRRAA